MGASAATSCSIFSEIVLIQNSRNSAGARIVRELRRSGAVLALATSASRSRAHSTLREMGLLNCFAEVVTGEDVLLGKPDPTIYRLACKRIGCAPERLLAVEDAVSGIRAAVGAGLHCVGLALHKTPENLIAAGAAHVVRSFESISRQELERILLRRDGVPLKAAVAGND
jgi:beta-phosphoglucomutase